MVEISEPISSKPMVEKSKFRHQLTPTLPASDSAFIVIELADPGRSYKAGEKIEGVVKIVVNTYFNASSVSLRLYGIA